MYETTMGRDFSKGWLIQYTWIVESQPYHHPIFSIISRDLFTIPTAQYQNLQTSDLSWTPYVRSRCSTWPRQYYYLNKSKFLYPSMASRKWRFFSYMQLQTTKVEFDKLCSWKANKSEVSHHNLSHWRYLTLNSLWYLRIV